MGSSGAENWSTSEMVPRWDLDKCEWPGDDGLSADKVDLSILSIYC